jgi:hypothetical protein
VEWWFASLDAMQRLRVADIRSATKSSTQIVTTPSRRPANVFATLTQGQRKPAHAITIRLDASNATWPRVPLKANGELSSG